MNIHNKFDVRNHPSAGRGKSQRLRRTAGRCEGIGFSKIESETTHAIHRTFVEDFELEHSFRDASITQVTISASSEFVKPAPRIAPSAYNLNSPNCIYFG